jgi:hypothetical protein
MLLLSPLIGQASGRLGTVVFIRGPRGGYVRTWVQPDETSTTWRAAVWTAMSTVAAAWSALTDAQRSAWSAFSVDHPRPNRLGQLRPTGGKGEFSRANLTRAQANALLGSTFALITEPSGTDSPVPSSPPLSSITGLGSTLTLSLGPSAGYSSDPDAAVAVWVSTPQPATRRAYYQAWRLIAAQASPALSTTFGATLPVGHQPASGQALFIRTRYFTENGELHPPATQKAIAP